MKQTILLAIAVAACVASAPAQTKISGVGKCTEKPDVMQMAPVGDRANHSLELVHQACNWSTSIEMEGLKSKTYEVSVSGDASGDKAQERGYVVVTMDNGDKAFVRFQGTSTSKDGKPSSSDGTWSFTGGTGKLKGVTGKGTYKGTTGSDGVFEDHVEGEYAMPAPKAKK